MDSICFLRIYLNYRHTKKEHQKARHKNQNAFRKQQIFFQFQQHFFIIIIFFSFLIRIVCLNLIIISKCVEHFIIDFDRCFAHCCVFSDASLDTFFFEIFYFYEFWDFIRLILLLTFCIKVMKIVEREPLEIFEWFRNKFTD